MVGDDNGESVGFGQGDAFGVGDAGIAGEQQVNGKGGVGQLFLQFRGADAVAFGEAVGNMKTHPVNAGQLLQGSDEQRRAGLPIDIKVTPDEDVFTGLNEVMQNLRRLGYPKERGWRGGCVMAGVEKGARFLRSIEASL